MTRTIFTALLILAGASHALAQSPSFDYGKPEELKGLKKVFVDTGGDIKNRERILKEIEKAKLGLELLDGAEGAEVILDFGGGKEKFLAGIHRGDKVATPIYRSMNVGAGRVFIVRDGRLRVVLSFEDEERSAFEKKPATNFGKTFVKAYMKANSK